MDPLAATLWDCRASATPVPREDWPQPNMDKAKALSNELYTRLEGQGVARYGWKAIATDARTQAAFGADGPVIAPLYADAVLAPGETVSLERLIAPVFEAEICLRRVPGGTESMPCIEIPDSRFAAGTPGIEYLVADFGAQAKVLFGEPGGADDPTEVVVTRDGTEVGRGQRSLDHAAQILALVDECPRGDSTEPVATGSIFPPIPFEAGHWVADFGRLGRLEVTAV
jgi:2-keto-4-pentenoate hydratase